MFNGLATTLAIITGTLLSPFVGIYDTLTGTQLREKEDIKRRKEIYNSLYEPMIQELKKRDPIKDAQKVFKTEILYLPIDKNVKSYTGFWQLNVEVADDNNERLEKNEYIQKYAFALYGVDEEEAGEKYIINFQYDELSMEYKRVFNLTMVELSKEEIINFG